VPLNTLILPLLAGWWVVTQLEFLKPRTRRYEGQRLLLSSAAAGTLLLFVSRGATLVVAHVAPALVAKWRVFAPFPYSGAAAGTVVLSLLIVLLVNANADREEAYASFVRTGDDHLERLLLRSAREKRSLALTLRTGKIYVGSTLRLPADLATERKSITILPLVSGYRDRDTQALVFTTDYSGVHERLADARGAVDGTSADEFELVIPVAEVVSANLFDWDVYRWFREAPPSVRRPHLRRTLEVAARARRRRGVFPST
jgi:hypothetical protein